MVPNQSLFKAQNLPTKEVKKIQGGIMTCFTDQKSAKNSIWSDIVVLVVLPIAFLILRTQYIIHMTDAPPTDFGSGSMFDKIASRYDITNRFLALNLDTSWRRLMVREVLKDVLSEKEADDEKDSKIQILDLATGTADVALLMAKEFLSMNSDNTKVNANIIGVDPSANMIHIGKQKVERFLESKSESNIDMALQLGDARNLKEFKESTFHGATMSFGIRNVPEKEDALCEIHRVMKKNPSSKFAILEFSEPGDDSGILGYMARFFIRHVVPVIGATLSGAPREYMHLQNSIKEFPTPSEFKKLIENLDCRSAGRRKIGKFRVDALHQLNFGSVQLYVATPYFK